MDWFHSDAGKNPSDCSMTQNPTPWHGWDSPCCSPPYRKLVDLLKLLLLMLLNSYSVSKSSRNASIASTKRFVFLALLTQQGLIQMFCRGYLILHKQSWAASCFKT